MKRTPLKRKTPLRTEPKAAAPCMGSYDEHGERIAPPPRKFVGKWKIITKQRKPMKKAGKLKPFSPKRAEQEKEWQQVRAAKLNADPLCEACALCTFADAVDVHHKAGRGKHLLTREYLMSVCRVCHDWIHANGKKAEALGYVVRLRQSTLQK